MGGAVRWVPSEGPRYSTDSCRQARRAVTRNSSPISRRIPIQPDRFCADTYALFYLLSQAIETACGTATAACAFGHRDASLQTPHCHEENPQGRSPASVARSFVREGHEFQTRQGLGLGSSPAGHANSF